MKRIIYILFCLALLGVSCKKDSVLQRSEDSSVLKKSGVIETQEDDGDAGIVETEDDDNGSSTGPKKKK